MSRLLYLLSYRTKLVFALPRSSGLHGRAAGKDDEKERGWSPVLVMTQENAFAPGDVRGYAPLVLHIVIVSTDALTLVPRPGFEPGWISPADFESAVSTNSTTRANAG